MRSGVSLIASRKMRVLEDGERDASTAKQVREIDLNIAALADDGFNGEQSGERAIAIPCRPVAKLTVPAGKAAARPCGSC